LVPQDLATIYNVNPLYAPSLTTAVLGGFSAAVTFSVQGLPAGVAAAFKPLSLAAPRRGSTVLKLSATSTATTGSATLVATATGGSVVATANPCPAVK
jgi:hypothetical protein